MRDPDHGVSLQFITYIGFTSFFSSYPIFWNRFLGLSFSYHLWEKYFQAFFLLYE